MKECFKCNVTKPLSEYYKHKQMGDGHLNKCKACTKNDVRERESKLLEDPEWVEQERARHREKYYRLEYKEKHKPSPERKALYISSHKNKFPEKYKAKNATQVLHREKGEELHHWSYNEEHYKDVIPLTVKEHNLLHRFLEYDEDTFYYRDLEGNLLDTKEKHLELYYNIHY